MNQTYVDALLRNITYIHGRQLVQALEVLESINGVWYWKAKYA